MKQITFMILLLFCFSLSAQTLQEKDRSEILKVLKDQRIAWNEGNIEKYMEGYWRSDSLRFIGKSGIKYGWDATLEAYKKGYPDR